MKIENLTQGSPEWLAYRRQHFNASDAPAMMGCSAYKTRTQLLQELHTGVAPETDAKTEVLYANGHRYEALARPLAEQAIGQDLYPVTASLDRLSASFDGVTMAEDIVWEHKTLNDELRGAFAQMETIAPNYCERLSGVELPLMYRVQMEQQLHISGADRALFTASMWSREECVEILHAWYYPDPALRAQILAGWAQFEADLKAYKPQDIAPEVRGNAPEALPALRIELKGSVTATNLADFKRVAIGAIRSVKKDLSSDQDFADAEASVKWCSDIEDRLKAAREHALSQTADIDALFKAIDDISAEARQVRLDLEKRVKARKEAIKGEIVAGAVFALREHVGEANKIIGAAYVPVPITDFAGAIKGKRTLASIQDAVDTELARAKIEATGVANRVMLNLGVIRAGEPQTLFPDIASLVLKDQDAVVAIVASRMSAHQVALSVAKVVSPAPAPLVNEEYTLKLGTVCERLGFQLTVEFVTQTLGIQGRRDGRALLFRESDFQLLCSAISSHVTAIGEAVPA